MGNGKTIATLTQVVLLVSTTTLSAQVSRRAELGRTEKLRILVDKVMQRHERWFTKEWMVEATAGAGFNVYSPRSGYERLDEVRQVAAWCEKHSIYYMPWMRGSLDVPARAKADGRRLLWSSGNEQPLWSPNSDEFWEWMRRYIVQYAEMSKTHPHLIGVFLDFENYAVGKERNLYSLSYDDLILGQFAQAKGVERPKLELAGRKAWLEQQGLHGEFEAFQVNLWRSRCLALRQEVDKHSPSFQFCIYPGLETPFIIKAAFPGWATEAAPVIFGDVWTYGRPSTFLPQKESLEGNKRKLLSGMKAAEESRIPFLYTGGIDPVVRGADPEFSGKNAVMISETSHGYWVFYEGPDYTKDDHKEYWKWFTWANTNITRGNLAAWREPRTTPENWKLTILDMVKDPATLVAPEVTAKTVSYPRVMMREQNILVVAGKKGQPVEIVLRNQRLAHYESLLVWELRGPGMKPIASGSIDSDKTGAVSFTPEMDGVYFLGASAGSCLFSVVSSNTPIALHAGERLRLIQGAERLYFSVPKNVEKFALYLSGSGGETVKVNVYAPDGRQVDSAQTTLKQRKVEHVVSAGEHAGGIWSLQITRGDEGDFEDNTLRLDAALPPALSFIPEHVFRASPKE
ncbi:MAG: hypothetical protein FJ272_07130 [Planctomycetes bacterium]|nr:hypothetical protein [Planctomycetota bacterium]